MPIKANEDSQSRHVLGMIRESKSMWTGLIASKPLLFPSSEIVIMRVLDLPNCFLWNPSFIVFFFISFGDISLTYSAYFWLFLLMFIPLFRLFLQSFSSLWGFFICLPLISKFYNNAFHSFPWSYDRFFLYTNMTILNFFHFFKINHSLQFYVELCDLTIFVFSSYFLLMFPFSFLLAFSLFFFLFIFSGVVPVIMSFLNITEFWMVVEPKVMNSLGIYFKHCFYQVTSFTLGTNVSLDC